LCIASKLELCLDVAGGKDEEGNKIQIWSKNRTPAQRWRIIYKKDMPKDTRTFVRGFKVGQPFILRSRMPHRRVIECIGASYTQLKNYTKNRVYQ
jgi:hypothetical protein